MKADELLLNELVCFENGKLEFQGRRLVLHDMHAFARLRQDLLDMLGPEHTRRVLTRFGYFWGQEDAAAMQRLFHWDNIREWVAAGPRLHSMQGVVRCVVQSLDVNNEDAHFAMTVLWHNSGEAAEHLEAVGQSETPVCWMLVGYASGYASYCLGQSVVFREKKCRSKGDPICTAEGRLRAEWGEEIRPELEYLKAEDIHGQIEQLTKQLRHERRRLHEIQQRTAPNLMEVKSAAFQRVLELSHRVAKYDTTVLVTGETGVGKEVVARHIHRLSSRSDKEFLAINCAALPENLLESELFGHKSGSFTGASEDRIGLFEQASGGTLFLDEIGDVSPGVQLRLLRALQEREIMRVGESISRTIDVRVIAATNRDLAEALEAGRMREDLYFRLSVLEIRVPPLRERPEDILPLARHFVESMQKKLNIDELKLDAPALDCLLRYRWPGNVRELENTIERAAVLSPDGNITPPYLPEAMRDTERQPSPRQATEKQSLQEVERTHIHRVLDQTGGNKAQAARILGISTATLWRRLKDKRGSAEG